MSGLKLVKQLTVAITTNGDGIHKLPFLFDRKSPSELGIEYTISAKGWMSSSIVGVWLQRFNAQIASENRRQRVAISLNRLGLSRRTLLPSAQHHGSPATTEYRRDCIFQVASHVDSNVVIVERLDKLLKQEGKEGLAASEHDIAKLYDATVVYTMRWALAAWEEVSCITVASCWHHTGILEENIYELIATMDKLRLASLSIASLAQKYPFIFKTGKPENIGPCENEHLSFSFSIAIRAPVCAIL